MVTWSEVEPSTDVIGICEKYLLELSNRIELVKKYMQLNLKGKQNDALGKQTSREEMHELTHISCILPKELMDKIDSDGMFLEMGIPQTAIDELHNMLRGFKEENKK